MSVISDMTCKRASLCAGIVDSKLGVAAAGQAVSESVASSKLALVIGLSYAQEEYPRPDPFPRLEQEPASAELNESP